MRESERKRLMEVLNTFEQICRQDCTGLEKSCTQCVLEQIADHLLDSGVIVPACKTGQNTYSKYGVELGEVKGFVFETYRGEDRLDYVLDWNYGDYDSFKDDDVGNTIFFTREDAVKALKGDEGK